MNNSLRQNWKLYYSCKIYPLGKREEEAPRTKQEAREWGEKIWKHLVLDDIKREALFIKKRTGNNKYNLSVWSDEENTYLVFVLRLEDGTDSISIWLQEKTQDNIQDFINLAKFFHKNHMTFVNQSLKNVKEFNEQVEKFEQQKLLNKMAGEA